MPAFEQGKLSRKNCCTHEQIELVKGKLGRVLYRGLKFVQPYTRENTVELVKENLLGKPCSFVHTSKESYQGTCQGKLGRVCGA